MKKYVMGVICGLLAAAIAFLIISNLSPIKTTDTTETNSSTTSKEVTNEKETTKDTKEETTTNDTTKKDTTSNTTKEEKTTTETTKDSYGVKVSKNEITVVKGSEESFVVTFTNPDETSIREYIHCDDQNDIVLVKYSVVEDKKTTVTVEGLKVGTTKIEVSDYEYPNAKEIVKVNVVEK